MPEEVKPHDWVRVSIGWFNGIPWHHGDCGTYVDWEGFADVREVYKTAVASFEKGFGEKASLKDVRFQIWLHIVHMEFSEGEPGRVTVRDWNRRAAAASDVLDLIIAGYPDTAIGKSVYLSAVSQEEIDAILKEST